MKRTIALMAAIGMGLLSASFAAGSSITSQSFSSDATSGISTSNTYDLAINLGGSAISINSVPFAATGSTAAVTGGTNISGSSGSYGYTLFMPGTLGTYTSNSPGSSNNNLPNGSGTGALTTDFYYVSGNDTGTAGNYTPETFQLTGLTPGQQYALTFYAVGFGSAGGRIVNVTDDQTATPVVFDENNAGAGNGTELIDTFTTGTGVTSFTVTIQQQQAGNSFHQYGFTLASTPEPASLGLLGIGAAGLLLRRRSFRA